MKIGIGIDTGGTCTDAVVYQFENREILAFSKTLTTKEDLSIGIGKALDGLPRDLVDQSEVIALSTTLATNACVEGKGGRAKLIMFGISPDNIRRVGHEYGLSMDDGTLIFIDSKTTPKGEITRYPDWDEFRTLLKEECSDCDAIGVVEMFAKKTGAEIEHKAREIIKDELDIPVVLANDLFEENNLVKRGASTLLNARLISVIEEFLSAVRTALSQRNIKAPFVIVRSDGSLMTGDFTATRPVETLLCGPVASVMGAVELSGEENCMIVDIGGTTSDIAFVKDTIPQRVKYGIRIGEWNTFVKGLFVDTFGLGGDSGAYITETNELALREEKSIPLCMVADEHPNVLKVLQREYDSNARVHTSQKDIFISMKDISDKKGYSDYEKEVARILKEPNNLENVGKRMGDIVLERRIETLLQEGVILRCGVTPTDAMHVKGDFTMYNKEAAELGMKIYGRILGMDYEDVAELIYDEVKRKLYYNLVRILIEDAFPSIRQLGISDQMEEVINDSYYRTKNGESNEFLTSRFTTPAVLVGVGAPTWLFLEDVAKLMGTKGWLSEYSKVANALGAVVGKVSATMTMEVTYNFDFDVYYVVGCGERHEVYDLDEAKEMAEQIACQKAEEEAIARGAEYDTKATLKCEENIVDTNFGALYMGYKAHATATGNLRLV